MDQDKEFALKVAVVSSIVYAIMVKVLPGFLESQTGMLGEIRDFLKSCDQSMSSVVATVLVATMIGTLIVVNNEGLM
jgi:hypothetical protein